VVDRHRRIADRHRLNQLLGRRPRDEHRHEPALVVFAKIFEGAGRAPASILVVPGLAAGLAQGARGREHVRHRRFRHPARHARTSAELGRSRRKSPLSALIQVNRRQTRLRKDKTGFRWPGRAVSLSSDSRAAEGSQMFEQDDEAITAFIRAKGVTRCPTACAAPTQAAADRRALRQRAERREAAREAARKERLRQTWLRRIIPRAA